MENSSAIITLKNKQPNTTCVPGEAVEIDVKNSESFFNDEEAEMEVTGGCESNGRKRSTGHIVLHFSVRKSLSPSCSEDRSCVVTSLRALRPAALRIYNAVKSSAVQVTVTTVNETNTFFVNPEAKWTRIAQGCGKGEMFDDSRCGEL